MTRSTLGGVCLLAMSGCKAWLQEVAPDPTEPPSQDTDLPVDDPVVDTDLPGWDSSLGFEEVSHAAGIDYAGESYGIGFGDFNGDGWPDIWSGNHAGVPFLYRNNQDGTFTEIALSVLDTNPLYDAHGVSWVDLDNDGDLDLLESVGAQSGQGVGANRVHLAEAGALHEDGARLGLDYPEGSGRCPVIYDWNLDGRLDVAWINQPRADGIAPTALFTQAEDGTFSLSSAVPAELQHPTALCGQLADVDGDRVQEVVRYGRPSHLSAHDSRSPVFEDVSERVGMPTVSMPHDVVVADFNGDLLNDLYVSRWRELSEWLIDPDEQRLAMALRLNENEEGVAFTSDGELTISLNPPWFWTSTDIRIGGDCATTVDMEHVFAADAPEVEGICPHQGGTDRGMYIGRQDGVWQVTLSMNGWNRGNIEVHTTTTLEDVEWLNLEPLPEDEYNSSYRDWLWLGKEGGGFVEKGWVSGFQIPTQCSSAVSGDFDNDMDLDLYLLCARPVKNTSNLLYRNDDGVFTLMEGFGASGSEHGRGDSVVTGDYDRDGFLDLFVTNGLAAPPFNEGPHELFHNVPNDNHWVELDLVGSLSNRSALGASVLVTAGGVTQLREQNGGTHHMGQNHTRLHVGLGTNETIDQIEVIWPDGTSQVLEDVDVDQILEIVEPS